MNTSFPLLATFVANEFNIDLDIIHSFLVVDPNQESGGDLTFVKGIHWNYSKRRVMLSEEALTELLEWDEARKLRRKIRHLQSAGKTALARAIKCCMQNADIDKE